APWCFGTPASSDWRGSCRSDSARPTGRARRGTGSKSRTPTARRWCDIGRDDSDRPSISGAVARRQDSRGYVVRNANGQALVYVYSRDNDAEALQAKVLTKDEARRIAVNVARLPQLLGKAD